MGDSEKQLLVQHSFYTPQSAKHLSDKCCKSDVNVLRPCEVRNLPCFCEVRNLQCFCDYYKRYEHDAVPVRDSTYHVTRTNDTRDKESLTNSELEKLEINIFKNMSQEFQTDNSSRTSLESNIKLFKTTVQEIFDNFYASMQDFELYKKRFNDILAKNQKAAVADMENFIKDMIQHIMLSESSTSNESRKSNNSKISNDTRIINAGKMSNDSKMSSDSKKSDSSKARRDTDETSIISSIDGKYRELYTKNIEVVEDTTNLNIQVENLSPVVEAYKNYDYTTDSTMDENKMDKNKSDTPKEEVVNIYLLSGAPCVQIKMTDRNMLSEINIKEPSNTIVDGKYGASAENLKKLAAKEKEIEQYVKQDQTNDTGPDREIPVKVSYAKRNIHLNEDFTRECENEKSFLSRICNFLCKRFRKL